MNKVNNNYGSTLVLTLAMITIFSILFITLATGSISHTKQIKRTEDKIQATSLAEMGIIHQKSYILTELIKIANDQTLEKKISDDFVATYGYIDPEEGNMESLTNEYIKMVLDAWTNELSTISMVSKTIDTIQEYKIENYTVNHDQTNITSQYISIGNNSNEEFSLRANIKIPIDPSDPDNPFEIIYINVSDDENGDNNTEEEFTFPNGNLIEEPTGLPTCKGNFLYGGKCQINNSHVLGNGNQNFNNAIVKINGTLNINGNSNKNTNSTIWVNGSFTTSKNFNVGDNVKLYVKGHASFNSNMQNTKNSIIEIHGGATFNNFKNTENTTIYIKGQTNINGHIDLHKGSIAYINGNLDITKDLDVSPDSKLCVNGKLNVNGDISNNNNIYAKYVDNNNLKKYINTNIDDFNANCTSGGTIPDYATQLLPYLKLKDDGNFNWDKVVDLKVDYRF